MTVCIVVHYVVFKVHDPRSQHSRVSFSQIVTQTDKQAYNYKHKFNIQSPFLSNKNTYI